MSQGKTRTSNHWATLLGADEAVLADTPAGRGGHSEQSMALVNSGYPRLGLGAVGVAPWQQ